MVVSNTCCIDLLCIFLFRACFFFFLCSYRDKYPLNMYLLGAWTFVEAYTVGVVCAAYASQGQVCPAQNHFFSSFRCDISLCTVETVPSLSHWIGGRGGRVAGIHSFMSPQAKYLMSLSPSLAFSLLSLSNSLSLSFLVLLSVFCVLWLKTSVTYKPKTRRFALISALILASIVCGNRLTQRTAGLIYIRPAAAAI